MKNLLNKVKLAFASFALIVLITPNLYQVSTPVQAKTELPKYEQTSSVEAKVLDTRALILQSYLAQKNSPMQNNAQDFIEAADNYGLDWKLVPAIAGVESTFGNHVPGGTDPANSSFNAYGWGVYGNQALYFDSWKDGIYTLNEGLKTKYIDRGLKTPAQINRVYAASPTWGVRVSYFMSDLEQFEQKYNEQSSSASKNLENSRLGNILGLNKVQPKPAPVPAIIAFK